MASVTLWLNEIVSVMIHTLVVRRPIAPMKKPPLVPTYLSTRFIPTIKESLRSIHISMHAAFVVNARTEHIKGSKGLYSLALNLNFLQLG